MKNNSGVYALFLLRKATAGGGGRRTAADDASAIVVGPYVGTYGAPTPPYGAAVPVLVLVVG